jgi:endonuclease-3
LVKLKGVGPKTAAIVLLFSLNMPAFPVDTHVYRVTGRLGIRPEKMSAQVSHKYLADQFHPDTYYPVHLNLIRLGREICKARNPRCNSCPLNRMCDYYENLEK